MVWISFGAELILVGLFLISFITEKKRGNTNKKLNVGIFQAVGMRITSKMPISSKKRDKSLIFQIMCTLSGEEAGREVYVSYREKRWGMIIGVVLLINTICLFQMIASNKMEFMLENRQNRPEYGQGARTQQVTVILEGEENAEEKISLQIPEKEISKEDACKKVQEGLEYVSDMLNGRKIKSDITLPTQWNEVIFYYESLSPDMISNSGKWMGEVQEESCQIKMKVTAIMGEEKQTAVVTLSTATLEELSTDEKINLLVEEIEEGKYLTENELILPEMTEAGERITWIETQESNVAIWILLGIILLLFVLWQQDQEYKKLLKERERKTRQSYPEFMNELVILVGAGLSLPAAWQRISQDYQKKKKEGGDIDPLYEEIYKESREMDAGASMREILESFASHMRFKEARRFAVLLTQNLKRGDAFLVTRLKELNQEAWDLRKKQVREKTEEADTKLLIPLMLMLVVVLIIVLSPAMITMQV